MSLEKVRKESVTKGIKEVEKGAPKK